MVLPLVFPFVLQIFFLHYLLFFKNLRKPDVKVLVYRSLFQLPIDFKTYTLNLLKLIRIDSSYILILLESIKSVYFLVHPVARWEIWRVNKVVLAEQLQNHVIALSNHGELLKSISNRSED